MRRVTLILACVFIFLCALSNNTHAAVPQLINYQGVLTDSTGAGLNTTVNITFTIYDDPSAGSVIWTEVQNITVVDGLFSALLGEDSFNPMQSSFFSNPLRYLGITVGADPEISPRTQLVSVPYSFNSEHASEADLATLALHADTADFADTAAFSVLAAIAEIAIYADSTRVADSLDGFSSEDFSLSGHSHSGASNWSVTDSVLYTNNFWGIARGDAGNVIDGSQGNTHTMVNLGVTCTTGPDGYTTIGGGFENVATSFGSTIGGGRGNLAGVFGVSTYCTVAGGHNDTASGDNSVVGGGKYNAASGDNSTISGGSFNAATGEQSTVGGGDHNTASGYQSTIGGGDHNTASGSNSFAAGHRPRPFMPVALYGRIKQAVISNQPQTINSTFEHLVVLESTATRPSLPVSLSAPVAVPG